MRTLMYTSKRASSWKATYGDGADKDTFPLIAGSNGTDIHSQLSQQAVRYTPVMSFQLIPGYFAHESRLEEKMPGNTALATCSCNIHSVNMSLQHEYSLMQLRWHDLTSRWEWPTSGTAIVDFVVSLNRIIVISFIIKSGTLCLQSVVWSHVYSRSANTTTSSHVSIRNKRCYIHLSSISGVPFF